MALIDCGECGNKVSDKAEACPKCGNPVAGKRSKKDATGSYCKSCKMDVTPVVSSVGGGSCSVGKRETWKCPKCKRVLHKSGCFVATATYGDEDATEVVFLRAFRDEILGRSQLGRVLTTMYYFASPFVAKAVEIIPGLRGPARRLLDRIVVLIERHTHLQRSSFRKPLP